MATGFGPQQMTTLEFQVLHEPALAKSGANDRMIE
jgi:hypothetical protein